MKKILILISLGALTLTSVAAQADHNWRKRKFIPQHDRTIFFDEVEDDGFVSYEDDEDDNDVIYLSRRKKMMLEAEQEVEAELWWLENNARKKLESRAKAKRNLVKKVGVKPVAKRPLAKAKIVKAPGADLQTASLSKPATKSKPVIATKTIGCTAGAAVVTGYGFGDVKPKACTGQTYAYTAARAGKSYEIKMTAASGEIIDVKKLN